MSIYMIVFLVWNIAVMLVYGIDKLQAKKGGRRISEKMLISCAFSLGGCGAMFGMIIFNHKTSKPKFRTLVPIATVFNIIIICYLLALQINA